ncbi:MAG: ankyrin repeat domain-containing protein [Alphaproteobacteria bacterium]
MAPKKKVPDDSAMRRSSSRSFERREEPPKFYPINSAAMENEVDKLIQLLEQGANIEQPDNVDHSTPLINACGHEATEAALELIKRGANIHAVANDGDTAIMWAAVNGMVEVGRVLIEKGCDMNIEVNSRKTIQEYARDYSDQHPEFYEMMLEAIETRDQRIAAEAQAAADARAKAFNEGATVLDKSMTVAKPITLKR